MDKTPYHIPALLSETIDGLAILPNGTYVDATFGAGGHSDAILAQLGEAGRLLAFDQDEDVLGHLIDDERFIFVRSNFRYLENFLQYHKIGKIDGLLVDLGVSFHHFDTLERGFSFRFDAPLDMRMNNQATITAQEIIQEYDEEQLADVFYLYGELRNARKIASTVVRAREQEHICTTHQLVEVLSSLMKKERQKKELSMVFQALRIEVNQELEALKELLEQSTNALKTGGRIAILTYHSLEDRLVKNFIRTGNFEGKVEKDFFGNINAPFRAINNKVIVATEQEVTRNPRARSAKLRIAERR